MSHAHADRAVGREKKQCDALLLHMFSRNDDASHEARDTTVTDYPTTKQRYTRVSSSRPRALFNIPRIGGYPLRAAASLMIKLRVSSLTRTHIHASPTRSAQGFFFFFFPMRRGERRYWSAQRDCMSCLYACNATRSLHNITVGAKRHGAGL